MSESLMTSTEQDSTLNTVTWWEMPVADLAQAQQFYGKVFGWTFVPFGEGYVGANSGSALIGGLFQAPDLAGNDGIRIYVNVPDLEATLEAAVLAGGSVREPRTEVGGDMGWWARITDPGGRIVGVCTSSAAA
jgi:predicted enzyme related to lactoylglutathione lyase